MLTKQTLTVVKDDVNITVTGTISTYYSDTSDLTQKLTAIAKAKNTESIVSGIFTFTVNKMDLSKLSTSFDVGSYNILASFVPTDIKNFNSAQTIVNSGYTITFINVYVKLALTTPTIIYGTMLTTKMLSASAIDTNGKNILGSFSYTINGSAFKEQILDSGTYEIDVIFTPNTPQNYTINYGTNNSLNNGNSWIKK
jgi:hypothetical protein